MRDIYLEKIKSAYIHANGGYPSDSQLSKFIYERKELSKKYYGLLEELGIGRNGIITELDKGCLDSILVSNDIHNMVLVEISENAFNIKGSHILRIPSSLKLDRNQRIVLTNDNYSDYDLSHLLDTVIVEGNIDINNSNLYAKMFSDNIDLYLGSFGNSLDVDRLAKIEKLKYVRDKVKSLYGIDLDVHDERDGDSYKFVMHNPLVKSIKSVDKR